MKPWLLACLVTCFVGAMLPAVYTQGGFEDCCLAYNTNIGFSWLRRRARSYRIQEVSGSCNLRAVIFVLPRRVVCGDPKDNGVKDAMRLLEVRKKLSKHHGGPWSALLDSHHKVKNVKSGPSQLPASKYGDFSRKSKWNMTASS
ncbi:PREDICTED: c-C motif chemokine 25 [Elephantulus edwardii]|uniref:c-C motif chemokine 25 n=1 Tax=Elephantulus edwardii TaxID=28737 RepID=UPI0003F06C51|nr:PREDICTED: c-C motif chemokine 25 [Elephantulus edwardii]